MQTFYQIRPGLLEGSSVAVGYFDGVHKGHQAVIKNAIDEANRLNVKAAVVTFKEHPRGVIEGHAPGLLTLSSQRLRLFSELGVEVTLALPFTEGVSRLSPEEYVQQILVECMNAKSVSIGYNHHFGRRREGKPETMRQLGERFGFAVHITPEIFVNGVEVSSSHIRESLESGNLDPANAMLGRRYSLTGEVIRGDGRGRKIGYPTANLNVPERLLLPACGVYAAMAGWQDQAGLPCVVNIGHRPTVSAEASPLVEAHIFDFDRDIYGLQVSIDLWSHLRPEAKFSGLDALARQIAMDCKSARKILYANYQC